ncbi:MAG: TonB-dependent receptor [candidate division Zixibacteria bacterium]|nr:TonB-dependent receptor [candidate division Zixibacteria bacterium]
MRYEPWAVWGVGVLSVLLMVLLFAPDDAEAARLTGKITDEKNSPLIGASVMVVELRRGAQTNDKGEFRLENLPDGAYTVQVQYIGYKVFKRAVTLSGVVLRFNAQMEVEPLVGETVTVTEDRSTAGELTGSSRSAIVLPQEKLEELRGQSLGETLESLPGVSALTTGPAVSKPVIRGVHSERVVVLNAGVTQEGQQWGGDHAPEIDPFSPARIEVLKGASGVEYGLGAIGGVIRIEQNPLRVEPGFDGRVMFNAFSNNRQGAGSLMMEGGLRAIRGLGWRVQGSLRRAGDSHAPVHVIRNSGFDERDYAFALGLHRDGAGLEAYYSHFGAVLGIYKDSHIGNTSDLLNAIARGQPAFAGSFNYRIGNPKQVVSHDLLSVKSHFRFDRAGQVELRYAYQYNERQEWDAHRPFSSAAPTKPGFDLGLLSQNVDLTFQRHPVRGWYGKTGVNVMRQENTRYSAGFLIPDFVSYSAGFFALETWERDGLKIEAGGRVDYRRLRIFPNVAQKIAERVHVYRNVTTVLGLVYRFAPLWAVGVDVGQAWRPPSVNEQYSNGVHHGTSQYERGDSNLGIEKSLNTALTIRYLGERGHGELGFFYTRFDDFIALLPDNEVILTIRGAFPAFRYVQSDASIRGFDGHFEYRLASFFSANVSVSVVRGRDAGRDRPLFHMPSDRMVMDMDFHLPPGGRLVEHSIGGGMKWVRRQTSFPAGVDFVDPPPGYTEVNIHYIAQVGVNGREVHLQFGADNLFNTRYRDYLSRYRYFIDEPGRSLSFRLSVPFGKAEL